MTRSGHGAVHIVQLTTDEAFCAILRQEAAYFRMATGREARLRDLFDDALTHVDGRSGAQMARWITELDLSTPARGGAARISIDAWRLAGRQKDNFNRSMRGGPRMRWTRRSVLIGALYCMGREREHGY